MARSMIGADSATLKQLTQNLEKYARNSCWGLYRRSSYRFS